MACRPEELKDMAKRDLYEIELQSKVDRWASIHKLKNNSSWKNLKAELEDIIKRNIEKLINNAGNEREQDIWRFHIKAYRYLIKKVESGEKIANEYFNFLTEYKTKKARRDMQRKRHGFEE